MTLLVTKNTKLFFWRLPRSPKGDFDYVLFWTLYLKRLLVAKNTKLFCLAAP